MPKYKLGVIGGMGPKATSVFFERIVEKTKATKDQDHIDLVVLNHASLPDRTHCIKNNSTDLFLSAISNDFKILENIGVDNIAIPCNTSHYFIKQMQDKTTINIINMVGDTIEHIYNQYGEQTRVGLLATDGTIQTEVYKKYAEDYNLELIVPSLIDQQTIMQSIYNLKQTGGLYYPDVEKVINKMIATGCSVIILACTELSIMKLNVDLNKIVDAMDILVEKSIVLSKERIK